MRPPQDKLRSIWPNPSGRDQAIITSPADVDSVTRNGSRDAFHNSIVKTCPADTWAGSCYLSGCPFPILVNNRHQRQLLNLNETLVKAITDIVSRWWSDESAQFPARMPLQPREEKLLRWLDAQGTDLVRPFRECSGSWRPDFLVEEPDLAHGCIENFRICEINARFSWNGSMFCALGHEALLDMGICRSGMTGETNSQKILDGLQRLYDPKSPLYLLKGKEHGYDIHLYAHYARKYLGQHIRFITLDELRLIPCPRSSGGYKLCCLADPQSPIDPSRATLLCSDAGEILEEITQVGLELHQNEILALSDEMLQQISLRCFNDMRTLLLVHDKRMLGIVLEELDSLVARDVLSPREASLLNRGICHTVLPGSTWMAQLTEKCRLQPSLKDEYILKPVRGGKGEGIVFGENMSYESWMTRLRDLKPPSLSPQGSTMVVQRKVSQARYEVLLREKAGLQCLPVVGTYHAVHGEFLGIGVWRSSPSSVCAISHGGAWMCSVMDLGRVTSDS